MKLKRSERMVVISNYLINNPYKLTSLNTFAERYEAAKSSISEDVAIIKKANIFSLNVHLLSLLITFWLIERTVIHGK